MFLVWRTNDPPRPNPDEICDVLLTASSAHEGDWLSPQSQYREEWNWFASGNLFHLRHSKSSTDHYHCELPQ